MSPVDTGVFLLVVFLGSYFQALTGFALGIVLMGYVALISPISLELAASLLTVLGLVNTVTSLGRGGWGQINWVFFGYIALGVVPGTVLGMWLLARLQDSYAVILQLILGITIIFAAISLILRPRPYITASSGRSFLFTGSLGGLLGGLFGVPGPPLIYHLYRQPVPVSVIRTTLLLAFALICLFRLGLETLQGSFSTKVLELTLYAAPVTAFAGWLYVRFPPKFSDTTVRRGSFVLFGVLGVVITAISLPTDIFI